MKRLAAEHPDHGGLVNLDKYYHCLTSCQMTKVCGSMAAAVMGSMKEWLSDDEQDSKEDQIANEAGRDCANAGATDCHDCCEAKGYRLWEA